jgi:hypothetical protein
MEGAKGSSIVLESDMSTDESLTETESGVSADRKLREMR